MPLHMKKKSFTEFSSHNWHVNGFRIDRSYGRTAPTVLVPNQPVNFIYGEVQTAPDSDAGTISTGGTCTGLVGKGSGVVEYLVDIYVPNSWKKWIPSRLAECRVVVGWVSENFVSPDLSTLTYDIDVVKVLDYARILLKNHQGDDLMTDMMFWVTGKIKPNYGVVRIAIGCPYDVSAAIESHIIGLNVSAEWTVQGPLTPLLPISSEYSDDEDDEFLRDFVFT